MSRQAKQALADAAERRLAELALKSELTIAAARALSWGGVALFVVIAELAGYQAVKVAELAWHHASIAMVTGYALGSTALFVALRRRPLSRRVVWLLLAADGVSYLAALVCWRFAYGREFYQMPGILAVVTMVCMLVAVAGAMRFSRPYAWISAAIAMAWFAMAARWSGLPPVAVVGLTVMLAMFGVISQWLQDTVSSAVRGERARTTLSRFLPIMVIERAQNDPASLAEPRTCDATILMSDVRGFSGWSEHRAPAEVLSFMSRVHGELADAVAAHGGYVDKFLGDGMLAVFGVLEGGDDHAARAVRCAIAIQERVLTLDVLVGIGLHSGSVVAGCIGTGERLEFTVLGDTVNTAARLQAHTKEAGVAVLLSGETADRAGAVALSGCGETILRGKDTPIRLFTLRAAPAPQRAEVG